MELLEQLPRAVRKVLQQQDLLVEADVGVHFAGA